MRYRIRIAGKIFEGNDLRLLLKRAVEAKRAAIQDDSRRTIRFQPSL